MEMFGLPVYFQFFPKELGGRIEILLSKPGENN